MAKMRKLKMRHVRRYRVKPRAISGKLQTHFACPHCYSRLTAALEEAGQPQLCPECQSPFIVPGEAELQRQRQREQKKVQTRQQRQQWQSYLRQREQEQREEQRLRKRHSGKETEIQLGTSALPTAKRRPFGRGGDRQTCPHCGGALPGKRFPFSQILNVVLLLVLLGMGGFYLAAVYGKGSVGNPSTQSGPPPTAASGAERSAPE